MSDVAENTEWSWWQNALAGQRASIDPNTPETGYYRVKRKGRDIDSPVAYWRTDGALRCYMDGDEFPEQRAVEIWPFASKKPVSYEHYQERVRAGKWPGDHEAVIGHNQAPPDDTPEAIADRIDDLARAAERMIETGGATSQEVADQASDLANSFGEIEAKTKDLHRVEKQPHLDAGRAVDTKWFTLRDRAADIKAKLKRIVVTPWLVKRDEEENKAKAAAIATGTPPAEVAKARVTAGSSKRSTGLRPQVVAEVTDWPALLAALHEHPDIREAAQKIANASAKAGVALPGTTINRTKVAA